MTGTSHYFESNRAQWDDRASIHSSRLFYDVEGWVGRHRRVTPTDHRAPST